MGELTIRTDRRIPTVRSQGTARGEKTAGSAAGQGAAKAAYTVSETLEQLTRADSRAVRQAREAFRALQSSEGALDELQNSLDRLGELARKAAGGGAADREALRQLRGEVRLLNKIEQSLLEDAVEELRRTKGLHDRLEALYRPHLDFPALDRMGAEVISQVLGRPAQS